MERQEVEQEVSWLGARLREPSTYLGLAGLLIAFHMADANSWATIIESLGIAAGGLIGIFLPERK